ncbi:MAG: glycosyltransferase family 9 protein [Bacteroidales bacterium]|nr:glycosyltransferase family 9 protein [Bacteroidales bacterium]
MNQAVKFLIIRFSSIGDIILTTPVIRMIKKQVENAEIHYLTKKQYLPLLAENPYIRKVHVLQDDTKAMIQELQAEEFCYIIDLHHNLRSDLVKRQLKLPAFVVDKINFQKWLRVWLKIDRLPQVHIVDRYLATTSVFDVVNDGEGLEYYIPENEKIKPEDLPFPSYVLMAIGGQHETKKMPADKLAELCSLIPYPVVLSGGKEDAANAEFIIQTSQNKQLFNACGSYSLHQSASLAEQAKVVITHDTGMMHIAAAFHQKIISIWGNTIPEFGMYPYQPHTDSVQFEVKGLSCRPCSKIGFANCPKKHFNCMQQQDLIAISQAVRKCWI